MSEVEAGVETQDGEANLAGFGSPPVAARPAGEEPDPRGRLHELARKLALARDRRLMVEYLHLRRSVAAAGQ